jgi:hypothetical protein
MSLSTADEQSLAGFNVLLAILKPYIVADIRQAAEIERLKGEVAELTRQSARLRRRLYGDEASAGPFPSTPWPPRD